MHDLIYWLKVVVSELRFLASSSATMFGSVPNAPPSGFEMPGAPQPWMVADPAVNQWLNEVCCPGTKNNLAMLSVELRNKVCISVYMRASSNSPPHNIEAYLNGAINKEKNSFYGAAPQVDPSKGSGPYAGVPQRTSAQSPVPVVQGRPPASPQHSALPSRPLWVMQAWAQHQRQKEFFRFLSRHLPAGCLNIIQGLPGQMQHTVLVAMILADRAHTEPAGFLQWMVDQYRQLPPIVQGGVPSSSASDSDVSTRQRLIVLSFGLTSALEWPAVDYALTMAKEVLEQTFHVVHKYSFSSQCMWKEVLDDYFANVTGARVEPVLLEDAESFVTARACQWRASGCSILALLHLPVSEPSSVPAITAAPGYHGQRSAALWLTFNALRALQTFFPDIGVATFHPPPFAAKDVQFFDDLFGKPLDFSLGANLRVPLQPWAVRCMPVAREPRVIKRPMDGSSTKLGDYHSRLHGAFDEKHVLSAVLPSLATLEAFLDCDPPDAAGSELKAAGELVSRGPAGDARVALLTREHLAAVCGVTEWKFCEFWEARLPCAKWVNSFTGQPATAGSAESVKCGEGRWCPPCSYFYEALTECPSPYLLASGVLALLEAIVSESSGKNLFSVNRLPAHACNGQCTGFSIAG